MADAPRILDYKVEPPQRLTVGDHFKVTIVVEADEGTVVQVAPGGIPDGLELAQSARYSTRNKGSGKIEVRIELVLAAFVLGDYPMPGIPLRYRERGGAGGDVTTPASRLLIESTIPSSAALEPRDLKPQVELGAPPPPSYALLALAGAVLAVATGLVLLALRRMGRRVSMGPALVPEAEVLGPEDAARRALDGAGVAFASARDYDAYYAVISRTVRIYLTQRYGFHAFALTTVELQAQMTFRGMDRWQARLVAGLLEQCDSVMFAGYRPAGERADADLTAAYEIVEMSRLEEVREKAGVS